MDILWIILWMVLWIVGLDSDLDRLSGKSAALCLTTADRFSISTWHSAGHVALGMSSGMSLGMSGH